MRHGFETEWYHGELGDKDETNIVNILLPGLELMSKTDHRSNAVEDYTLQFLTQI